MSYLPGSDASREVALVGGTANRGLVFRVGSTVRRPAHEFTGTGALFAHLEDVGFDAAPRYLGEDDRGRSVLTYIPGEAVVPPYPAWALTDGALLSVAALLLRFQEAVQGFDPTPWTWPPPLPEPFGSGSMCHNDPNLDNIVFRDGRAVALIDFDRASPGDPVWDVAATARLWAPLRADEDIDDSRRGQALRRLRLLVDAYGLDAEGRALLPAAVLANHDWSYDTIRTAYDEGHEAFTETWLGGAAERSARTRQWYLGNGAALRRALA